MVSEGTEVKEEVKDEVFWMLYAEGNNGPAVKHSSLEVAHNEAIRICNKSHIKVHILQVVETVELASPTVITTKYAKGMLPLKIEGTVYKPAANKPECFGQYTKSKKRECEICAHEYECEVASNG